MRNRMIGILLCALLAASLSACGGNDAGGTADRTQSKSSGVSDVLEERMAEEDAKNAGTAGDENREEETAGDPDMNADDTQQRQSGVNENAPAPEETDGAELSFTEGIDVDLTALSSTMVYSAVYDMMSVPENYVGRVVKMNGLFAAYYDGVEDKYYYACIVLDAAACCSQGIEFELAGEHVYPDDYPAEDDEITVVGTFDTYTEDGYLYCTLRTAQMIS